MTWGVLLRQNIPGCYQLKDNLQKSGNNNDGNNEYYRKWFTDEIFLRLAMLPGLDGELKQQSILFSAVNILLSITGILGNCLILVALRKESSLHLSFKLLYRCLATTDLLVGLVNHPFYTTYVVGLRYKEIVTLRRTYIILAIVWVVCPVGGLLFHLKYRIDLSYSFMATLSCLAISITSYAKIFSRSQSSSGSNTRTCSTTTKPTKYTEHSAIQKGTVQCTVGTISFSCLLCTTSYSGICDLF